MKEQFIKHPRMGLVPKSVPILDEQEEDSFNVSELLNEKQLYNVRQQLRVTD